MLRQPNVWIVVTATAAGTAAITMTSLADRDSRAEPRVTTRTRPVVPQRRILRSEVNLGRSVRGRPIRAIVLGDPNATRPAATPSGLRSPPKRSPRRSQPQLRVRMAAARAPRRPAIRRTTGTLRARESPRTHADRSPPAAAHNLVPSMARHHRSIRRRRPNRGPLRRPEPTAVDAATALPGKRRDMGEPPTLERHRIRR